MAVGTNNIFTTPLGKIPSMITKEIEAIRELLPEVRLIWSDVLPRQKYEGEIEKGTGKECTVDINKAGRRRFQRLMNIGIIRNSHIFNPRNPLYRKDGTHLNDAGQVALVRQFESALLYFRAHPAEKFYPPKTE